MEEAGDTFVIYLSVSCLDGWEDRGPEHNLGRLFEVLSD
jgi:hypothetical protein